MPSNVPGYLAPSSSPAPLEGQALSRFVQGWVSGVTGLDGTMVRPRWLPEPSNIPKAGTAWCAVGISTRRADTFAYAWLRPDASYLVQRHERIDLLASFYDLGSSGLADYYAALLREGAQVPQNREPLFTAGFGLIGTGDVVAVPSLLKERWLYRADLAVELARVIERVYPVLSVLSANGTLKTSDGVTAAIVAAP